MHILSCHKLQVGQKALLLSRHGLSMRPSVCRKGQNPLETASKVGGPCILPGICEPLWAPPLLDAALCSLSAQLKTDLLIVLWFPGKSRESTLAWRRIERQNFNSAWKPSTPLAPPPPPSSKHSR